MADAQIDILKTSIDWAKAEIFSSSFFALMGLLFILTSIGFWQLGKTGTAKAFIIPLLVAGGLLVVLGVGLIISNQLRISSFATAFSADSQAFLEMEIARAEKTINGYNSAVYKVIPLIIAVCAVLLMVFRTPIWQAGMISVIAMMAVILLVDTNANTRMQDYKDRLLQAEQQ